MRALRLLAATVHVVGAAAFLVGSIVVGLAVGMVLLMLLLGLAR